MEKKIVEEELSKLMEITLRLEDELNLIGMEQETATGKQRASHGID